MQRRTFLSALAAPLAAQPSKPNIVLLYADDVGYGDLSCYGATSVKTPNLDRIARQGVRFTDAHSSSATCTPSRYSLLTGEYAWRKKGTGVLPGDARLIIDPGKLTMPKMLQRAGYRTGVVGKWHLGLGTGDLDWNTDIRPGPLEVGFDSAFLMPATGDRVPCVYVQDHKVVGLDPKDPIRVDYTKPIGSEPTGKANPELLKMKPSHGHDMAIVNGVSRIGYMTGGKAALWNDETMADRFATEGERFISSSGKQPFFLYFATHDIHVPRLPNRRFSGKTTMGPRGDAIAELDWTVGRILKHLDRLKLTSNTILMFSSDNGPVVDDGYVDQAVEKLGTHRPAGVLRGGKYSNFEAGTRVPLMVSWPARMKPGTSDALVSQVDFFRSFAALTGQQLSAGDAPDSANNLAALTGESRQGREWIVEQSRALSLRQGAYKYIEPNPGQAVTPFTNTETGANPAAQLYNLASDPGEKQNLATQDATRAAAMSKLLNAVKSGEVAPA